jgi:predicted HTH transcriptional regulator
MTTYTPSHRAYYLRHRDAILKKRAEKKTTRRTLAHPAYREIYQFICQNPGNTELQIAQHFKTNQSNIVAKLATCENQGLLVYQDENGGLFPYNGCDDE